LDLESQIKTLQLEKTDLVVKAAKAEERVLSMNKAYEDLKISMSSMGEAYKTEFKNVANELLELKSKSLDETSSKNIKPY